MNRIWKKRSDLCSIVEGATSEAETVEAALLGGRVEPGDGRPQGHQALHRPTLPRD